MQAEIWAHEAVEKTPEDSKFSPLHTLLTILGAQGKWQEAFEFMPALITTVATEEFAIQDVTDILIAAAAAGHAKQVLQIITEESEAAATLEPLATGIRLFLGETPLVAQEIREVGQDVAQRIRDQQGHLEITSV